MRQLQSVDVVPPLALGTLLFFSPAVALGYVTYEAAWLHFIFAVVLTVIYVRGVTIRHRIDREDSFE
jgi:hypothetical protein